MPFGTRTGTRCMMLKLGLHCETLRSITHYQNTLSIVLMIRREKTKNDVNDNEPLFIVILKSTFTENPNKETAMPLYLEQEEIYYE